MSLNRENNYMIRKLIYILIILIISLSCSKEEFGGIGIEVPSSENTVSTANPFIIVSVFEGGTAHRAGLLPGDEIISINGKNLKGLQEIHVAKNLLRGKPNSMVVLDVIRNGEEMIFRMPRGKIIIRDE